MEKKPAGRAATKVMPQTEQKKETIRFILPDPMVEWSDRHPSGPVVVLRSRHLGDQTLADELGESLMLELIKALAGRPAMPSALLLYSSAVQLAAADSPVLDLLKRLQDNGCEILCCQISHAALSEDRQPAVGHLADWIDLTDRMQKASRILWP